MNRTPLLSIVITVFNTERFLPRCMKSVLEQSYKNIEVIVVNDGSEGNIREDIKEYLKDSRVRFIDAAKNSGLLMARVIGAKEAHGEYIAFADSDDYMSYDFYRALIQKAEETGADITIGKTVWENHDGKFIYNLYDGCFQFEILSGADIKKGFFGQETRCYPWHTIWNKIYKRALWEKCSDEFSRVTDHIVMTEDIFFSSILFFKAELVAKVNNDAYFYCQNENASTDVTGITIERFRKNVSDIGFVFNNVENFLKNNGAHRNIIDHLHNARAYYARMWRRLGDSVFKEEEKEAARNLIVSISTDYEREGEDDFVFESIRTPWRGGLEYIKEILGKGEEKYILFDLFDTLVTRPLYSPGDLFRLMDSRFSEAVSGSLCFSRIRTEAEEQARRKAFENDGRKEVRLEDIYDEIADSYGVSKTVADRMREEEKKLEVDLSARRESGWELFNLAGAAGKKICIVTDMYLDRNTIEKILRKNGYSNYDALFISSEEQALKYNGELFMAVLKKKGISPDNAIHVGDSWKADVEGSRIAGIKSIFFPKAIEVFENRISDYFVNRCADIAGNAGRGLVNHGKAGIGLGYRCMQAMAANKYFDNPYRVFNPEGDFNADPNFIGYYPLGMHMLGLSKWMLETAEKEGKKRIVFLARDGFLPMITFKIFASALGNDMECLYLHGSRKALMPFIVNDKINFHQLPIEIRNHNPGSLFEIIKFASGNARREDWIRCLKDNDIDPYTRFQSPDELHPCVKLFLEDFYSKASHDEEKNKIRQYFANIDEKDIFFDMGYSGRIQSAICEAVGMPMDVMFLHEDYETSGLMRTIGKFGIHSFYGFRPEVSGLFREHIFSDTGLGCSGFKLVNGRAEPVLDTGGHDFQDRYMVESMHSGACEMAREYMEIFSGFPEALYYSPLEVSLPFEGYLNSSSEFDNLIFAGSYFEDEVYGGSKRINILSFINDIYRSSYDRDTNRLCDEHTVQGGGIEESHVIDVLNSSSKIKRALLWILLDKGRFREKLKLNLFGKKVLEAGNKARE